MSDDERDRERKRGLEEANKAVSKLLAFLHEAGGLEVGQLENEQERATYVSRICSAASLAVATMPAVQHAMSVARPEIDAEGRYFAVTSAIVRAFGFEPQETQSPRYLRPRDPTVN
jgi:hypothetical protein